MPHLTLEYTNNLVDFDSRRVLMALNRTLIEFGHFEELDIKSRAVVLDSYLVGTSQEARAFIHVKLSILSGRSAQVKSELSNALLRVLSADCKELTQHHLQLCVEIIDIDRPSYAKEVLCTS